VREIVVDRADEFDKSPIMKEVFGRVAGNGLICSDGEHQKKQRRLIMPALHYKRVQAYGSVMAEVAEARVARWGSLGEIEISAEMFGVVFRVLLRALFGADVDGFHETIRTAMLDMQESLHDLFNTPMPMPQWLPTATNRRLRRTVDRVDSLVARLIAEKRASGVDTGDFLSMLVLGEDPGRAGMSDREVFDEAKTMVIAGLETTVYMLLWIWVALAENPEVEARLHAELARVLGGRRPTPEDVKKLPYTTRVLNEAVRVYPPVWAFNRAPTHDTKVEGFAIKKGEMILISPYLLQRDPRFFANPERFDPDRFVTSPDKYTYIPFGIGPRACIGAQFAMMEATVIVATIAQRWRLTIVPGQDTRPVAYPALRPKNGVRMALVPRHDAVVAQA
jgi:cytochrome P450